MIHKKFVSSLLCVCLVLLLVLSLTACSGKADEPAPTQTVDTEESSNLDPEPEPAPEPSLPFTDVPDDSYYYDAVKWALDNEIVTGEPDTQFGPDTACTRGQVITVIWRAMGSPEPWIMENPFTDISTSDWYYEPALWAYQHGVSSNAKFNQNSTCSCGEALTFLWRAEGRPIAVVANSPMASTNSDAYYARALAWAEKSGLFSGTGFDPDMPCRRADIVNLLYWAGTQWEPEEEERTIRLEYEEILYGSQYYPSYAYADYIDADGDGKAELLTLDYQSSSSREGTVTVRVYANISGHVEKSCEEAFEVGPYARFSLCESDGQPYLIFTGIGNIGESHNFYKIGKAAVEYCEEIYEEYREDSQELAILQKYKNQKDILYTETVSHAMDGYGHYAFTTQASFLEEGLVSGWDERERYWTACWEEADPMYAAVLRGDFSAFAGNYEIHLGPYMSDMTGITMDENGVLSGRNSITSLKPRSVSISEYGEIDCELLTYDEGEAGTVWESYVIYPVGIGAKHPNDPDYQDSPDKVRIIYWYPSHGVDMDIFTRIS